MIPSILTLILLRIYPAKDMLSQPLSTWRIHYLLAGCLHRHGHFICYWLQTLWICHKWLRIIWWFYKESISKGLTFLCTCTRTLCVVPSCCTKQIVVKCSMHLGHKFVPIQWNHFLHQWLSMLQRLCPHIFVHEVGPTMYNNPALIHIHGNTKSLVTVARWWRLWWVFN